MCNKIDTIVMGHSCSDCTDKYFEKMKKQIKKKESV